MLGSKTANAPENNSFVISFMHLKYRSGLKKDGTEAGETRWELDYRTVKTCSLAAG